MSRILVACSITAVALTVASPARAEPITIVSNGTGVAGLAYAAENGIEDIAEWRFDPDGAIWRAGVGGTSADAAAFVASELNDPLSLRANGSTSVSYSTEIGQAEGHVQSAFFVFFELDGPRRFMFDGQFQTSDDAVSAPVQNQLSEWNVSLLAFTPDLDFRENVMTAHGYDSTNIVREGLLTGGLYRFAVISTSFGGNLRPGPGSGSVFSNFTFSLDLRPERPVPEPTTLLLIGTGLSALIAARRRA